MKFMLNIAAYIMLLKLVLYKIYISLIPRSKTSKIRTNNTNSKAVWIGLPFYHAATMQHS